MKRQAMRALVVLAFLVIVGEASAAVVASNSFDGGLGGWTPGRDAEGSSSFVAGATATPAPAHGDNSSATLNAEGGGGGGAVWLESGVTVDPGAYQATVSFWVYSCNDGHEAAPMAIAAIKTEALGGVGDFVTVRRIEPGSGWQHIKMTKTIFVERGQVLHIGVGFRRTNSATVKYAFDDLSVNIDRPACKADVDGSGSLNVEDVFAFVDGWMSGASEGDFDGSGRLDALDIFAFLDAWLTGCEAHP